MLPLIGYASGIAAGDIGCSEGPVFLQSHPEFLNNIEYFWSTMLTPNKFNSLYNSISDISNRLAEFTYRYFKNNQHFVTIGGDHTSAIGTWSGLAEAARSKGEIGLIWVDAHMDAHTIETSETGNIHGMPLAALLGYGHPSLTQILTPYVKIKPENICLIGVRSFETGESALLENLSVRIYFMDEVKEKGLNRVMLEAKELVTQDTYAYGVSIDLDSIDPTQAAGVGTPVPNGLNARDLISSIMTLQNHPPIALEIAEYNPFHDPSRETASIIAKLLINYSHIMNPKFEKTGIIA